MHIGARGGATAWRGDFPLDQGLPDYLEIDCAELRLPIHPMFAVRLRTFIEWHRSRGKVVELVPPNDAPAAEALTALGAETKTERANDQADTIVPVTQLPDYLAVERVAEATREILEYQLTDVSTLGEAAFVAVSELCGNAIEHGENDLGAFVAVRRTIEPVRVVSVAIGDLGLGIPEHLRRVHPEFAEDDYAIARAIEPGMSGTGDTHRGYGYDWIFEKALTASAHAASIQIHSLRGFFQTEIVQEVRTPNAFPAANYKRGTWICLDLISA